MLFPELAAVLGNILKLRKRRSWHSSSTDWRLPLAFFLDCSESDVRPSDRAAVRSLPSFTAARRVLFPELSAALGILLRLNRKRRWAFRLGSNGKPSVLLCQISQQGSAADGGTPQIRAPAPRPCPRRRPSVVTEGYIQLPPCRWPTSCRFRFTPGSPPVHDYRCNLQCILRVGFLQGFVAFAVSGFHLGDVRKPLVFHGFGSSEGVRNGKLEHRANIGQDVGYMGQNKAKIGASLRQHRANIGQDVGYMGRHKAKIGTT